MSNLNVNRIDRNTFKDLDEASAAMRVKALQMHADLVELRASLNHEDAKIVSINYHNGVTSRCDDCKLEAGLLYRSSTWSKYKDVIYACTCGNIFNK